LFSESLEVEKAGCPSYPSIRCALIQVPAGQLCGDAGGSPEIELFGRENGSSNGSAKSLKLDAGQKGTILLDEITRCLRVTISHSQDSQKRGSFDRAMPRSGNSMSAFTSGGDADGSCPRGETNAPDLYYRLSPFTGMFLRCAIARKKLNSSIFDAQACEVLRSHSRTSPVYAGCLSKSLVARKSEGWKRSSDDI
jgi:hypothetical protein